MLTPQVGSPSAAPWPADGSETDRLLGLLGGGELTLAGLIPWSSNYTFLGEVSLGDESAPVVYKPIRGEQPLFDFPRNTLAKREVAAYVVCRALGWDLVPPTVLRTGPHGRGSVQIFVNVDQDAHFFTFRDDPAFAHVLRALAIFDLIPNNADRKGGHCLRAGAARIIAIDHGLCFHVHDKLRTVIWDFAGEPFPADLAAGLARLELDLADAQGNASRSLAGLLDADEIAALRRRIAAALTSGTFPNPPEDRRPYPWPLV
jgi:uncharacterized repeat protein (TIGR03843 family)